MFSTSCRPDAISEDNMCLVLIQTALGPPPPPEGGEPQSHPVCVPHSISDTVFMSHMGVTAHTTLTLLIAARLNTRDLTLDTTDFPAPVFFILAQPSRVESSGDIHFT